MRAQALVLGLLLAGCASPGEGAAGEDPCSVSGGTDPDVSVPSKDGCACPWMDGCGPPALSNASLARLIVESAVPAGNTTSVGVRNTGEVPLYLSTWADHCPREAWTSSGRQVWTYCGSDYGGWELLDPAETFEEFTWSATTCLDGRSHGYGGFCVQEQPLPEGRYELRVVLCRAEAVDCDVVIGAVVDVI